MISIITPTFNRADLIQATIKSVLQQTYTDWELIVVDDGSTDDTSSIMKTFTDPRIRYYYKTNTGQADTVNYGVRFARGEFITFLDSDDEAYPNWLQVVSERMKDDTGIVCVGAMRRFADGKMIEEGMNQFRLFGKVHHLKFTCGSLFIRRWLFNEVGGYDATLKSNIQTDLGYRLLINLRRNQMKAEVIEQYLLQINVHDGPRIRTNWKKRKEGGIQFLHKHYDFIKENDPHNIADICATIAFANYKLKNKLDSMTYMLKAIRYNPWRWVNYARLIKYTL